jgi:hypothetical protein
MGRRLASPAFHRYPIWGPFDTDATTFPPDVASEFTPLPHPPTARPAAITAPGNRNFIIRWLVGLEGFMEISL